MNKVLILDYDQWRCGSKSIKKLGEGATKLLNNEGFMCCLGQFSLQLGAKEKQIKGCYKPDTIPKNIPLLNTFDPLFGEKITAFSRAAITINDNYVTTPLQKIERLTILCQQYGYDLVVLNLPK